MLLMSVPKERLIESAVRPLEVNAEMRLAAKRLLDEAVIEDAPGTEDAVARWNAVDAKRGLRGWQTMLWVALAVVSVTVLLRDYQEIGRYVARRERIGREAVYMPKQPADFTRNLTREQTLLLSYNPKLSARKELWRLDPDNPAYFAEYAVAYARDSRSLPPDFLTTARRLDPENAWFTWLAAAVELRSALEPEYGSHKEAGGTVHEIQIWKITDQARADRASAMIAEAKSQPKFENYVDAMHFKRQAILTALHPIDQMARRFIFSGDSPDLMLGGAAHLQVARAWLAAEAGDVAGFQEACRNVEHFLRQMAGTEGGFQFQGTGDIAYLIFVSNAFRVSAEMLGLERETARWKAVIDAVAARATAIRSNDFLVDGKVVDPYHVGGMMFGSPFDLVPQAVRHPPLLTDAELKPSRMLDHEILSRFCGYLTWGVMGISLMTVAAYRFRVARLNWRLAERMEQLLNGPDWAWLLGAGVVMPLAYVMAVNRLTPLGGHQFGMLGSAFLLPFGHFLGLIVLWLVVPLQIVRWRMAKRAAGLGFPQAPWQGWLAAAAAMAFIPLIGWAGISRSYTPFWADWIEHLGIYLNFAPIRTKSGLCWLAIGVLAIPVFWLCISLCRALLSVPHRLMHPATTARVLVKIFPVAMVLIALATMAFKASERSWFERDRMTRWNPAKPGWTPHEAEVAAQLKKEMLELLSTDNGPSN